MSIIEPKTRLNDALRLAATGFYIFPCKDPDAIDRDGKPAGKRPRLNEWQQASTTDQVTIKNWWYKWPRANIGIDTGKSGLLVVDIDPDDGGTIDALPLTAAELATVAQNTGGGGHHLLYRQPVGAEFGNSAGRLGPGIDTRGVGGYIIGPGSIHPAGGYYKWADNKSPEDLPCLELPATLAAKLKKDQTPARPPGPRDAAPPGALNPAYVQAALKNELELLRQAANGTRNDQLNRAAYNLGQIVAVGELAEEQVVFELEHAAELIGLGEVESSKTIRSGLEKGKLSPRIMPETKIGKNGSKREKSTGGGKNSEKTTKTLDAFGRGETGDAELFEYLYSDKWRYDHAEKTWYSWSGHYWQADVTSQVKRVVSNEVAAQYIYASAELKKSSDPEDKNVEAQIKALQKRAGTLRFKSKINNVLDLAQSQPSIALTGNEWEQNPLKLAVQNGVIDLSTGIFAPGHPEDLIRTAAPVEWQGLNAPSPRWDRFLQEIFSGDSELICFVQRLFGYAITGQCVEHILPILWGAGRNGKGTLLETIKYVLGDLAGPVSKDVLIGSNRDRAAGSATPHLAALRPLRIGWVSETKEGSELDVDQVKLITGGDTITARKLHCDPISYRPKHTLFLLTNAKPKATHDDYALWQRLMLIPFNQAFVAHPNAAHEHLSDTALPKKLREEAPGILAWLVRGAISWQKYGLKPPASVRMATKTYQDEQDEIGQFIDECCIVEVDKEARPGELYQAYEKWAASYGLKAKTLHIFGRTLGKRFKNRNSAGKIYCGIGILQ